MATSASPVTMTTEVGPRVPISLETVSGQQFQKTDAEVTDEDRTMTASNDTQEGGELNEEREMTVDTDDSNEASEKSNRTTDIMPKMEGDNQRPLDDEEKQVIQTDAVMACLDCGYDRDKTLEAVKVLKGKGLKIIKGKDIAYLMENSCPESCEMRVRLPCGHYSGPCQECTGQPPTTSSQNPTTLEE